MTGIREGHKTKNRLIWVDVLNICACAGVLMLHCTNYALWDYSGSVSIDFCFSIICHSFILWPVDVFFMLTGYTLIKKTDNPLYALEKINLRNFYSRRLSRLLIPVLVWNTYYSLLLLRKLYSEGNLNIREFVVTFLQFESNGFLWFFIPLIGIYIVLPYYSVLCNSLSRNQLRNFIIIAFCCICIPATVSQLLGLTKYDNLFPIASGYLLYTTMGYYFGNYDISSKNRRLIYIVGITTCSIMSIELFVGRVYHGVSSLPYMGIGCCFSAISFFLWIRNINFRKYLGGGKVTRDILKNWSSLSLGVYLIQMTLLSLYNKWQPIDNNGFVRFVILYPICLICVYGIKRVPYLRKIV